MPYVTKQKLAIRVVMVGLLTAITSCCRFTATCRSAVEKANLPQQRCGGWQLLWRHQVKLWLRLQNGGCFLLIQPTLAGKIRRLRRRFRSPPLSAAHPQAANYTYGRHHRIPALSSCLVLLAVAKVALAVAVLVADRQLRKWPKTTFC